MDMLSLFFLDLGDQIIERFRSEDRTGKTSVRTVVGTAGILNGIVREIIETESHKTPFLSTPHDTCRKVGTESFREEGDDMELHLRNIRKIILSFPRRRESSAYPAGEIVKETEIQGRFLPPQE